jgi:hypothetical protein
MTRQELDALHEQYARLVAVAENNIGHPHEKELWKRADHFWTFVVLPAKTDLESAERQAEHDRKCAEYQETLDAFLAGTR